MGIGNTTLDSILAAGAADEATPQNLALDERQEKFLVTFQVALVGRDCTVIGSDRLFSEYYRHEDRNLVQHAPTCKILICEDKSFVCAHAGGAKSREMAEAIVTQCHPHGPSSTQWEIHLRQVLNQIMGTGGGVVDELLIARAGDASLIRATRKGGTDVELTQIQGNICAGDIHLPARFLPTHLCQEDMSEDKLRRLALLTLACAHEDNPSGVGGGYNLVTVPHTNAPIPPIEIISEAEGHKQFDEFRSRVQELI